jgi:hypothetical protein
VNIFNGIINVTLEHSGSSTVYTEQITPYEVFRWDLYSSVYNLTGLVHNTAVYATDDLANVLNDYQVNLTSLDVAIYIDAELSWEFTLCDFKLLDQQCNFVFASTWNNITAHVYENATFKGSANENVVFTWQRNIDYGVLRNVTVIIDDGSTNTTLSYFYRNEQANQLFVRIDYVKIDSERISISVSCNWEQALFYVDDNATAGLEVTGQLSGTFVFTRTTGYGIYQINVTGVYDFNDNGVYDSSERDEIIYYYYVYEENLIIEEFSPIAFIDQIASFSFKTNYRESNRTQFRVKPYNSSAWTSWYFEANENGSHSWDTSILSHGSTYLAELEVRCNITTTQGNQSVIRMKFYYTVYEPEATAVVYNQDPVVTVNPTPVIDDDEEEIQELNNKVDDLGQHFSWFSRLLSMVGAVVAIVVGILVYRGYQENKFENRLEKFMSEK